MKASKLLYREVKGFSEYYSSRRELSSKVRQVVMCNSRQKIGFYYVKLVAIEGDDWHIRPLLCNAKKSISK